MISRYEETIIFLSKYPTLRGYCLVSPTEHVEDLAEGMSPDAYLRLQRKIHRLYRALRQVFGAERIYVLSLGSQQANRHLHFHVVPLNGILDIAADDMAAMRSPSAKPTTLCPEDLAFGCLYLHILALTAFSLAIGKRIDKGSEGAELAFLTLHRVLQHRVAEHVVIRCRTGRATFCVRNLFSSHGWYLEKEIAS